MPAVASAVPRKVLQSIREDEESSFEGHSIEGNSSWLGTSDVVEPEIPPILRPHSDETLSESMAAWAVGLEEELVEAIPAIPAIPSPIIGELEVVMKHMTPV
jgi:hypothetical protein